MKLSDIIKDMQRLVDEIGDYEICKKQTGGIITFKPVKINLELQEEVVLSRKIVSPRREVVIKEVDNCYYVEFKADIKVEE